MVRTILHDAGCARIMQCRHLCFMFCAHALSAVKPLITDVDVLLSNLKKFCTMQVRGMKLLLLEEGLVLEERRKAAQHRHEVTRNNNGQLAFIISACTVC
jgi:hypothetical protein